MPSLKTLKFSRTVPTVLNLVFVGIGIWATFDPELRRAHQIVSVSVGMEPWGITAIRLTSCILLLLFLAIRPPLQFLPSGFVITGPCIATNSSSPHHPIELLWFSLVPAGMYMAMAALAVVSSRRSSRPGLN